MKLRTFRLVERVAKWGCILFAWICWGFAIYYRSLVSVVFVIAGFLPYVLIYNGFVRGTLERKVTRESADSKV